MQVGRWVKQSFLSVLGALCLPACATHQQAAGWLIIDGCVIKVEGMANSSFDDVVQSMKLAENCNLEIETDKENAD